jgi:FAD/FMN-containing dehydrogenase
VYVNFLSETGSDALDRAYGTRSLRRLQEVKRTYDPDNVFHINQNILPI